MESSDAQPPQSPVYETLKVNDNNKDGDTTSSPPLSPAVNVEKTTDLLGEIMSDHKNEFDLPWDMATGNRLSMQISVQESPSSLDVSIDDEDEDFSLVLKIDQSFFVLFYSIIS